MEGAPSTTKEPAFSPELLEEDVLRNDEKIYQVSIERVEDAIRNHVDYPTLGGIFLDILKKTYPEKQVMELQDKVTASLSVPRRVSYSDVEGSSAYTNGSEEVFFAKDFCDENGNVDYPKIINVLFHETLHDLSTESGKKGEKIHAYNVGFAKISESDTEEHEALFDGLNEGMTELLKDAVFSEYLARTGNINEFKETSDAIEASHFVERNVAYSKERLVLHRFIKKIADVAHSSEEDIFKALVVEYMKGHDLSRQEIIDCFQEYPIVIDYIKKLEKDRILPLLYGLPEHVERDMQLDLNFQEADYVTCLFGRDRVGQNNVQAVERHVAEITKDRYNKLI